MIDTLVTSGLMFLGVCGFIYHLKFEPGSLAFFSIYVISLDNVQKSPRQFINLYVYITALQYVL